MWKPPPSAALRPLGAAAGTAALACHCPWSWLWQKLELAWEARLGSFARIGMAGQATRRVALKLQEPEKKEPVCAGPVQRLLQAQRLAGRGAGRETTVPGQDKGASVLVSRQLPGPGGGIKGSCVSPALKITFVF